MSDTPGYVKNLKKESVVQSVINCPDIMQSLPPYPVFDGEKYMGLAYKYILADQQYRLYVINQVLCNVEYQADGSTRNMWLQYLKNPKGFACFRKLSMIYPRSPCRRS